jgi:hypothetical protein
VDKPKVLTFSTAYWPLVGGAEIAIQEITKRLIQQFDFLIFTAKLKKSLSKKQTGKEGLIYRLGWGIDFDKYLNLIERRQKNPI